MDEPKETEVSLGNDSESAVNATEHAAGETLGGSEASVKQGQTERVFSAELVEAEGAERSCNGGDIMVEVLGSDVYVDGVCTSRDEKNLNEEGQDGSLRGQTTSEQGVKPCERDDVSVCEPESAVSAAGACPRSQTGEEGFSGVSESLQAAQKATTVEGVVETVNEVRGLDEVRHSGVESSTIVSSSVRGSVDRESAVVNVNDGGLGANEEPMLAALAQSGSNGGQLAVSSLVENGVEVASTPEGEEERQERVGGGNVAMIVDGDCSSPKDISGGDGAGKAISHLESEQTAYRGTVNDCESTQVSAGGDIANDASVAGKEMEMDDQDTCVENHNLTVKADGGGEHEIEIIGSGDGDRGVKLGAEAMDRVDILPLTVDEVSNSSAEVSQPDQNDQPEKSEDRVGNSCTDQIGLNEIDDLKSEKQLEKNKTAMVDEKKCFVDAGSAPSCRSDQVIVDCEVAAAEQNCALNPNVEVSSEYDQQLGSHIVCRRLESESEVSGQEGTALMDIEEENTILNNISEVELKNEEILLVEQATSTDQDGLDKAQEMGGVADAEATPIKYAIGEQVAVKSESSAEGYQARYQLPPESEAEFSVSDLVWGKVRSHPWWPGQIFDPSDSSEKALRHQKKDYFLVAYFGDRTFAWNEASHLKPFRTHFSHEENQSNSESFQNAVDCALEELSRRVELGLTCACTPKDVYEKIRFQIIKNGGIREESSRRDGVDKSANVYTFEPVKLVKFVRELAQFASCGSNRLELAIAKSQLTSFYRLKGCVSLPEFICSGAWVDNGTGPLEDEIDAGEFIQHYENDGQTFSGQEALKGQNTSSHKRKHNLRDGLYSGKKEKSLSELMVETMDSADYDSWSDGKTTGAVSTSSSKKRKSGADHHADDPLTPDGRRTISFAKVSNATAPKQSFKIGDCIRRVASQLTGTPMVKSNSEKLQKSDGSVEGNAVGGSDVSSQSFEDAQKGRATFPPEYSSLDELLSQLQLFAREPLTGYSFLNTVVSFFSDFRDSVILGQYSGVEHLISGGKKKTSPPETFEFEDMSDTYWTDRVIQNGSEEQPNRRNRKRDYQLALVDPEKSPQGSRRSYSRKRYSVGNQAVAADKPADQVNERSDTELVMNFSEVESVPSEAHLNKMFRRFGPLRESETQVDRQGGRARVVFKKSSDAEVAFSSAGKFNIFGPTLVNYQLNHTPSALFKASPIAIPHNQEMHLDLTPSQYQDMQLDLASMQDHEMQLDLTSIQDHDIHLDLSTIQYQDMDHELALNHDQYAHANFASIHLGEMQSDLGSIQYEPTSHDPEERKSTQSILAATQGHELHPVFVTQEQEMHPDLASMQVMDMHHHLPATHPDLSTMQEQEMHQDPAAFRGHEIHPDHAALQEQDMQVEPVRSQEQQTEPDLATTVEPAAELDHTIAPRQEAEPDGSETLEQELELDCPAALEQKAEMDHAMETEQEAEPNHATNVEQQAEPHHATNKEQEVEADDSTNPEQEAELESATDLEQETENDIATNAEQQAEPDCARNTEPDVEQDHVANREQEVVLDQATTNPRQEAEPDHARNLEQVAESDCTTAMNSDVEANPDCETNLEQAAELKYALNQEQEKELDCSRTTEHETKSNWAAALEQEPKPDNATTPEQEPEVNRVAGFDQEAEPGHATTLEQEAGPNGAATMEQIMQPEHNAVPQQDMEVDHSIVVDPQTQHDHDMRLEPKQSNPASTQDLEMVVDLSSLEKDAA